MAVTAPVVAPVAGAQQFRARSIRRKPSRVRGRSVACALVVIELTVVILIALELPLGWFRLTH